MKHPVWSLARDIIKTAMGCALFALGFDLFLLPGGMNAGGLSGLAMIFVHVTGFGSVGVITALLNIPLFITAGMKIGKKFFVGSFIGMAFSSVFIDQFDPKPLRGGLGEHEPLATVLEGSY